MCSSQDAAGVRETLGRGIPKNSQVGGGNGRITVGSMLDVIVVYACFLLPANRCRTARDEDGEMEGELKGLEKSS